MKKYFKLNNGVCLHGIKVEYGPETSRLYVCWEWLSPANKGRFKTYMLEVDSKQFLRYMTPDDADIIEALDRGAKVTDIAALARLFPEVYPLKAASEFT